MDPRRDPIQDQLRKAYDVFRAPYTSETGSYREQPRDSYREPYSPKTYSEPYSPTTYREPYSPTTSRESYSPASREPYSPTTSREPYSPTSREPYTTTTTYRESPREPYRETYKEPYTREIHREPYIIMDPYRRPILHDDTSTRPLRDMQRKMDDDWDRFSKRGWNDDFDQICEDFFHLKPRPPRVSTLSRKQDFGGSRESLDGDTVDNLFVENPGSQSRKFQISFNVKEYDPNEISVHIKEDTLLVEAKHEMLKEGGKTIKEFNRKIKIPPEVDPEKLISSLSNDGILTITAPVPPKYNTLAHGQLDKDAAIPMPSPPTCMPPGFTYTTEHSTQLQSPPPPTQSPTPAAPAPAPAPAPVSPPAPAPAPVSPPAPAPAPESPAPTPKPAPAPEPDETLDTPVYSDTQQGRRMDLMLEIGLMYTPEDLLVKVEGNSLLVEATHEVKAKGKTSKSTMSRQFDLTEDIDPDTVQASLGTDGKLRISARVPNTKDT